MRLSAKKIRISEMVSGKFFVGSKEGMKPSYVITQLGEKISRVNLIATIVDKFVSEDGNYASITVDDGSGILRSKQFTDVRMIRDVELGDMVLVIGKLKEYQGEVYVNAEIIRKVEPNVEIKHKLEVLKILIEQKNVANELRKLSKSMSEEELKVYAQTYGLDEESVQMIINSTNTDYKPKILELLQTLDTGNGVEASKIFEIVNLPENIVENALSELLDDGYIYEPSPGMFKKI